MTQHNKESAVEMTEEVYNELVSKAVRFRNGDSFPIGKDDMHAMACCDCGLVHLVKVEEESPGQYKVITWRSNELTEQFRNSVQFDFPHNPVTAVTIDNRVDNITVRIPDEKEQS